MKALFDLVRNQVKFKDSTERTFISIGATDQYIHCMLQLSLSTIIQDHLTIDQKTLGAEVKKEWRVFVTSLASECIASSSYSD